MKTVGSHLSVLPSNARLMVWHPQADLAAFRIGDAEYLLANGTIYKFDPNQGSPAQLVATLRTLKPRQFTRCMQLLPDTFKQQAEKAKNNGIQELREGA